MRWLAWMADIGRGQAPVERPTGSRFSWLFFLLSLLFAIGMKSGFVVFPMLERPIPIEADDSFVRIFSSERNLYCFRQQCPGLESTRRQVANAASEDVVLWDFWTRVSILSDPWFSLALSGLKMVGIPLVKGHEYLSVVIAVGVMAGIGYWLCLLFGPGAAGIALIWITVFDFPGDGLSAFRPNELALGLAMLTWAEIARRGAKSAFLMFVMILLMSGSHLIGKAWSVVSLVVYAWSVRGPLTRAQKGWWMAGLVLVGMAFVLPVLFFSGTGVPTWDGLARHSISEMLAWNLPMLLNLAKEFFWVFKRPEIFLALLLLGMLGLPLSVRRHVAFWLGLFSMVCLASLIEYHATHPGHLLGRVIVPLTVLVFGLTGYGFYYGLTWVYDKWREGWTRRIMPSASVPEGVVVVVLSVLLIALINQSVFLVSKGIQYETRRIDALIKRHDFGFFPEQPASLLHDLSACGGVVYTDLYVALYYFAYGAYRCETYMLTNHPRSRGWVREQSNLRHLVTRGPVSRHYGNVPITHAAPVSIRVEQEAALQQPWRIGIRNAGSREARLRVQWTNETDLTRSTTIERRFPGGWSGWLVLEELPQTEQLQLDTDAGSLLFLTGLRHDRTDIRLRWPWDQGVSLQYADVKVEGGVRQVHFSSQELWSDGRRKVTILDDAGSSVLAKIE